MQKPQPIRAIHLRSYLLPYAKATNLEAITSWSYHLREYHRGAITSRWGFSARKPCTTGVISWGLFIRGLVIGGQTTLGEIIYGGGSHKIRLATMETCMLKLSPGKPSFYGGRYLEGYPPKVVCKSRPRGGPWNLIQKCVLAFLLWFSVSEIGCLK